MQNLQDRESNNCNIEVEKNSLNEEKIATSKLQNLQDLHQIEIKNDKERILDIYNTQQKQQSVQAQKTIEYPTSAKDCELLFESYISKYKQEHQALMGLPISMEAEKFFLYWSEKGWKRGKTKIKSLAGCVATWVGNWLDRNERRYPKTMTPRTLEQEITSYRAYGEEVERFVKEREQQGKTSLTIEDFQVIAG
ncbi:MAG: hypothetical protein Q4E81_03550 [Succinatimonas sp.]|nr:hypothetical protein [Succinatimonas sp.]